MKTMKFREFKAKMILDGSKSSSIRLFDDKNFQVGDTLDLIVWETGQSFAKAIITEVVEKPLGEINDTDLIEHERWESPEEMLESFRKYYTNVDLATTAKIVRFHLLK